MSPDGHIKLCDFGSSLLLNSTQLELGLLVFSYLLLIHLLEADPTFKKQVPVIGTPAYLSPEIIRSSSYSPAFALLHIPFSFSYSYIHLLRYKHALTEVTCGHLESSYIAFFMGCSHSLHKYPLSIHSTRSSLQTLLSPPSLLLHLKTISNVPFQLKI